MHSAPLIWGAGVYASTQIGSGQSNHGFTVNANKAKGSSSETTTTHTNTQVTVGGTTVNDIGGNLILDGANLDTKHLTGTVGGDLIVKSRQDGYQYTHDQKQAGFSADVGFNGNPQSFSINGGKTDVDADYAQVTHQSGIKAQESTLSVQGQGKFTGGYLITDAGKNQTQFAQGIQTQDIENHLNYEGDAISVGVGIGADTSNPNGKAKPALQGIGYGTIDPVNKTSTTHSAITDQAGLSHINTENFKQAEVQHELNEIITNDFNKEQVLTELGAQVNITTEFDNERRTVRSEFAKKAEGYRKQAEKLPQGSQERTELEAKAKQIDDNLRLFDGITSALYAPNSNGIIGDVARAASPELAYRIGQYFKNNKTLNQLDNGNRPEEQSANHLLAHAVLGAAVSYATGNNIATGAISGATNEAVAPVLSNYLYGTNDPSELSQDQKDTITSILNLATVATAYTTTGGNVTDTVNAVEVGKVGVENNNQIEEIRLGIMQEDKLRSDPEWDKAFREAERKQLVILNEAAKLVISPYGAGVDYYNAENLSEKALAIASAIPAERAATKGYGLAKKLFEEAAALYKSNKLTSAGKKVEQAVVELQRGRTNQWSQLANKPQANSIYRFDNGFQYTTDAQKRVKEVSADLRIDPWNRNAYQQRIAGGSCRQESDCGGHLIASIFGGPGEAINLVPMDAKLNGAGGAWYTMETRWKNTLENNGTVQVKIEPIYIGNSKRPTSFKVREVVNGKLYEFTLQNTETGK